MPEEMQPVTQSVVEPVEVPVMPPTPPKSPWILILSLLLILSLTAAAYFFFQYSKLSSTVQIIPSPTPTPTPSADPTANWQTYTNTSANYVVKYPLDWKIENQAAGSADNAVPANSRFIEIYQPQSDPTQSLGNIGFEELGMLPPSEEKLLTITKEINGQTLKCLGTEGVNSKLWCWVKVPGQEKYLNIHIFTNSDKTVNQTFYQILSTFKFVGAQASTSELTHYILKDKISSVDYPKGWTITDNTKQLNLDGKLEWSQDIIIAKNGYKLYSRNPLNWGPGICVFPDSPDYDDEVMPGTKYSTFTEFTISGTKIRRVNHGPNPKEPNTLTWGLCTEHTSGGYGDVAGFGTASYETPKQYDEAILKELDQILSSIKSNK